MARRKQSEEYLAKEKVLHEHRLKLLDEAKAELCRSSGLPSCHFAVSCTVLQDTRRHYMGVSENRGP